METFPTMVQGSPGSVLAFVAIVWSLVGALLLGAHRASTALGQASAAARRFTLRTALAIFAWLAVTGLASGSGVMRTYALPPPLALFALGSLAFAVWAALSPFGARLARGLPLVALVSAQAFRLPLELVLHRWYDQGVIPVQMTYAGHNFDIVTGLFALGAASYMAVSKREPRVLAWAFNVVGSALLLAVIVIAVLSSPIPIRTYLNAPPLLLAVYFPYGWIVSICVAGALFLHLVTFRRLLARDETAVQPNSAPSQAAAAIATTPNVTLSA